MSPSANFSEAYTNPDGVSCGAAVDDFNGGNFDHADLDFLHGGNIAISQTGRRPIANNPVPPGVEQNWGSEFKQASVNYFNSSLSISAQGAVLPYRDNYLDLDPTNTATRSSG